jgi:predicted ArsR family transcriptional regulator
MKTSRQRLLEYVQTHRIVTSRELSRALKMTAANARHHLSILESQGLVEVVGERPSRGRGRPARLYSLSAQALGHGLHELSAALLDEFLTGKSGAELQNTLERIAGRLAGSIAEGEMDGSLTQRLYNCIQRLNELGYQAHWEAHAGGPQVILGRCPYASLLVSHPELCRMDAALLEELLEIKAHQTAKLAVDRNGERFCMFALGDLATQASDQ